MRLGLLGVVAGSLLLGLQLRWAWREYGSARDRGVADVTARADVVAAQTGQLVWGARRALERVAGEPGTALLDPAECARALPSIHAATPFFLNVVVGRGDGRVVCSAGPSAPEPEMDLADRAWFEPLMATRDFTVSAPYLGQVTPGWLLVLAVPLRAGAHGDGVPGYLAGAIELARFQELLSPEAVDPGDLLTIADARRVILARSVLPEVSVGRSLPPPVVPDFSYTPGDLPYTVAPDRDGVERVWAETEVADPGWTVFAARPETRVFGPARTLVRGQVAWGLGLALLSAALAVWAYRGVGRPLERLAEGAGSAEPGAGLPIPDGAPREVRLVAESFERAMEARDRARLAERRARDRYRSLFERAAVGIYVADWEGRVLEANPALVSLLGFEGADELKATGLAALHRSRERRAEILRDHEGKDSFHDVEVEWTARDGTPRRVLLSGSVVERESGGPIAEVFVRDVTRQRTLEEITLHQQKMEAVGRLAGGLAHEFNNVLTVIGANMEMLRESLPDPDAYAEVDEVIRAAERAGALTRKLLAFSRKDATSPREVDLNAVVSESRAILGKAVGGGVEVLVSLDPRARHVVIDPGHVEQALLNLAINARDAMEGRGRLTVSTRRERRREAGADGPARASAAAAFTVLTVDDDGPGIPEARRNVIFEPFFTTKPPGVGTGLGLSVVHGMVEEAGGFVRVDAGPLGGARFELWLPEVEADRANGRA